MDQPEAKQLLLDIKKAFEGHNDTIVTTIKQTVNGKIDHLKVIIEANERKLDKHIEVTNAYIEKTKPMVEFFEDTSGFRKVSKWLLGGVVAVGGAYLMFREIIR